MNRRALLSTIGVAAVGGCQRPGLGDETVSLRTVEVGNRSDGRQTVTVRIGADGDLVHDSTHELEIGDPSAAELLDRGWPAAADAYAVRVAAGVEDEEVTRVFDERVGGRCFDPVIQVSRGERLESLRSTSGECRRARRRDRTEAI